MKRTVLLTGATGYIGRRFEKILRTRPDIHLRLLVRHVQKFTQHPSSDVDIIEGDTLSLPILQHALTGVHTAVYLVQPVEENRRLSHLNQISATHFLRACLTQGVKKIIYLSGLEAHGSGSSQIPSHTVTGKILSSRPDRIRTLWLRTGIIIGSGSHSFEILHDLVKKTPAMVMPRWAATKTRCIGVEDVIAYLNAALDVTPDENVTVNIGLPQITFLEMLRQTAQVMGIRCRLLPGFPSAPRLSSSLLMLLTRVSYQRAAALVKALQAKAVDENTSANQYFPQIRLHPFPETIRQALDEVHKDHVLSRWCDSTPGPVCDIDKPLTTNRKIFYDVRTISITGIAPEQVFAIVTRIGGKNGWFSYSFLWNLRGWLDKIVGGYGVNRGRRKICDLRIGDALDFWKVADLIPDKRLLLVAQLKLPGKGWLEFDIQQETLRQTAGFVPNGLMGYLYWYAVLPFHNLVFPRLCQQIATRALKRQTSLS